MCNLYNATSNVEAIRRLFNVTNSPNLQELGDIYPGRPTVAVYEPDGERLVAEMKWGFKRQFTKRPINNVRAETIDQKPMWRKAFAERRCILPTNWFVEWKGPKGSKVKYAFSMPDGEPYGIAGVWEFFKGDGDEPGLACSMVVGPPNDLVADYHDRMPSILRPEDYDAWLAEPRKDLLRPCEGQLTVKALNA